MALDPKNPILAEDIEDLSLIKYGKIIILYGTDGSKLVLKDDAGVQADQLKTAKSVIKTADPKLEQKQLTPADAEAVLNFIEQQLSNAHDFLSVISGGKKKIDDIADSNDLKVAKQGLAAVRDGVHGNVFLKMKFQDVKDLKTALEQRLVGDKSAIKGFIRALKANPGKKEGGLETLGRVIACDQFNGNGDRFAPQGAGTLFERSDGRPDLVFKTIINLGNVFVVTTDSQILVSALDFVDPNSIFKDPAKKISDTEKDKKVEWPFRHVLDKTQRNQFAENIVADLEAVLHPKKGRHNPFTKLGTDAAKRLAKGMVLGAKDIEAKLTVKIKKLTDKGNRSDKETALLAALEERLELVQTLRE